MSIEEFLNDLFGGVFRDHHARRECGSWHDSTSTGDACRPGFVYIVQFGDLYKIGATNALRHLGGVKDRINAVNKQVGQEGKLIGFIETNCAQGFERWLHREFREKRVRTEFFRLHESDLEATRNMIRFNNAPLRFFRVLRSILIHKM